MEQTNVLRHLAWITAVLAAAVVSAGCDYGGPQPPEQTISEIASRQPQPEPEPVPETEPEPESRPEPAPESEPDDPQSEPEPVAQPDPKPEPEPDPEPEPEPTPEPAPEPTLSDDPKPLDLGPPLVKDSKSLVRLHKTQPVWVDKANKRVVMVGQICQREALLELS